MAITKVGVIVSKNRDLSNPLIFENRGGQVGENTVQLSGLDAATLYYTKGYFVQDGVTTEERQIHSFNTAAEVDYFWIENVYQDGYGIELRKSGTTPNGTDIAYSFDKENWTPVNSTGTTSISIPYQSKVYFRSSTGWSRDSSNYWYFYSQVASWKVGGNISTLLNYNGDIDMRKLPYCFYQLFRRMTTVSDASELVIDLPTLGIYSCAEMFYGCTNLVSAPSVNSIVLDDNAFSNMFYGCTALTQAPATLPATTLANSCYYRMFYNCASLLNAPALPATVLTSSCYQQMFYGCTALTQAPILPATALADYCYYQMFSGCNALTQAPVTLPATTLAAQCYNQMFYGCTALTQAPVLPATTLAQQCYYQMFYGCTALTQAPATLPATTLAQQCYYSMFYGCSSLTQAPVLPATTLAQQCYQNMFFNCTALTQAPALPATTLARSCYNSMFYGCTALTQAPALPATTLEQNCYYSMFQGCSSLTQAPALPATTLADNCYYRMFYNCSGIQESPELPATTLVSNCYYQMFYNCSQLSKITVRATSWNNSYANNWAYRVAASGNFYNLGEASNIPIDNASGVPVGWTVRTARAEDTPLTFKNTASGTNTISLNKIGTPSWDITLDYSTDNGSNWTTWSSAGGDLNVILNAGESVMLKGNNHDLCGGGDTYRFSTTDSAALFGNIVSLVDQTLTPVTLYQLFRGLFKDMIYIDVDDLYLASTLNSDCYKQLFYGCTSLTKAPALPATTLAPACYNQMFRNCTALAQAPVLPATTLATDCYDQMFKGCTSLVNAPVLPATTLAEYCYQSMFAGCTSLTQAPALPATTLAQQCYTQMFEECTSLTQAPALPATTMASNCYRSMFYGTAITQAPALPATTLAVRCYSQMFLNCTELTQAPELPATTLEEECYLHMFNGCTSLVNAPELPATTLSQCCYGGMFSHCTSLNRIVTYANDISAQDCISYWLLDVSGSGDFYNLGSATYPSGNSGIPSGWTEHTSI